MVTIIPEIRNDGQKPEGEKAEHAPAATRNSPRQLTSPYAPLPTLIAIVVAFYS